MSVPTFSSLAWLEVPKKFVVGGWNTWLLCLTSMLVVLEFLWVKSSWVELPLGFDNMLAILDSYKYRALNFAFMKLELNTIYSAYSNELLFKYYIILLRRQGLRLCLYCIFFFLGGVQYLGTPAYILDNYFRYLRQLFQSFFDSYLVYISLRLSLKTILDYIRHLS